MEDRVSEVMVRILNGLETRKLEEVRQVRHTHQYGLIASVHRRYTAKRTAVLNASIDLMDIPIQDEEDIKVFSEILNEVALTSF